MSRFADNLARSLEIYRNMKVQQEQERVNAERQKRDDAYREADNKRAEQRFALELDRYKQLQNAQRAVQGEGGYNGQQIRPRVPNVLGELTQQLNNAIAPSEYKANIIPRDQLKHEYKLDYVPNNAVIRGPGDAFGKTSIREAEKYQKFYQDKENEDYLKTNDFRELLSNYASNYAKRAENIDTAFAQNYNNLIGNGLYDEAKRYQDSYESTKKVYDQRLKSKNMSLNNAMNVMLNDPTEKGFTTAMQELEKSGAPKDLVEGLALWYERDPTAIYHIADQIGLASGEVKQDNDTPEAKRLEAEVAVINDTSKKIREMLEKGVKPDKLNIWFNNPGGVPTQIADAVNEAFNGLTDEQQLLYTLQKQQIMALSRAFSGAATPITERVPDFIAPYVIRANDSPATVQQKLSQVDNIVKALSTVTGRKNMLFIADDMARKSGGRLWSDELEKAQKKETPNGMGGIRHK